MFTYLTLLISHVYTVLYTIHCTLPTAAQPSLIHILTCTYSHSSLSICVYQVVVGELLDYLLDITALSELEEQAFRYTHINIY